MVGCCAYDNEFLGPIKGGEIDCLSNCSFSRRALLHKVRTGRQSQEQPATSTAHSISSAMRHGTERVPTRAFITRFLKLYEVTTPSVAASKERLHYPEVKGSNIDIGQWIVQE